jgi:hypothetical protein
MKIGTIEIPDNQTVGEMMDFVEILDLASLNLHRAGHHDDAATVDEAIDDLWKVILERQESNNNG